MKLFLTAVFFFFLSSTSFAQTGRDVNGLVQDTAGIAVFGATVKLMPVSGPGDTLTVRTIANGSFSFKNVKISQFIISVISLGYNATSVRSINTNGTSPITVNKITLRSGSTLLSEVVISGAPAVTIKEDTIEYHASDLKLKAGAVVEDAIKRLDGAEVDKDGNVTASGKAVTRIKVDGKEMFGGDMKTATKNIPMDAIDKIQIIDDYGDQASFTGVKDGDPETIINITTKPGRNHGVIFNSAAGGGTEDRYQFGVFASQFEGDRNLGVTANLNNNGTQVGGGGFGGRANGGGGMNFGANGGGNSGITTLSSIGLNYNDRWSKKILVSGGYFFTNSDRSTLSLVDKLSPNSLGQLFTNENGNIGTVSNSHSFNARFQYNINKKNLLVITPFVSFSGTKNGTDRTTSTFEDTVINQNQRIIGSSKSTTPSVSGGVLYNHLFKKPGRNYSLNLNVRDNNLNSDQGNQNFINYYKLRDSLQQVGSLLKDSVNYLINSTANRTFSGSSRLIFSEPLSKNSRLQFSYNLTYNHYDNSKLISSKDPLEIIHPVDSLSNIFQYSFTSHQAGLNYNYRSQKNDLSLGLTANPTQLIGNSTSLNTTIRRTNFYLAPIVRYQYKYSRTRSMMINYSGTTVEPLFSQLQPIRDVSNPQRPIVGNPDLNSSFAHALNVSYNTSNRAKHTSLLLSAQGNLINNQIVQNLIFVPDPLGRKQEVHYVNTNGYFMYFVNYNWQKSFKDRQYTLRLNGDTRLTENPYFSENARYFADRTNVTQRVSMEINPGNWLEISPRFVYVYTGTNYTGPNSTNTRIQTYSTSIDGRIFFLKSKTLIWGFNGNKTYNSGYSGALSTNPLIINSYIEKQFLKNKAGILRLQGFDLLNQSNNLIQTITDNGYTNTQTNRLTQYFMLSFTVKINKFAGINPAAREGQNGPNRGEPGGNPGGGRQGGLGPGFGN